MLFTIGYEKSKLHHLIGTLQYFQVRTLIDIRDRAQSRRPGFSKTALSTALQDYGIDYLHLRVLGDPKAGREAARAGRYAEFRQIYDGVLKSAEAAVALEQIAAIAAMQRACLMCYEARAKECHRAIVASALMERLVLAPQHLGVRPIEPVRPLRDNREGAAA